MIVGGKPELKQVSDVYPVRETHKYVYGVDKLRILNVNHGFKPMNSRSLDCRETASTARNNVISNNFNPPSRRYSHPLVCLSVCLYLVSVA